GTGVTVNSVLPGPTRSEGVERFVEEVAKKQGTDAASFEAEFFRTVRPSSLLKRFATPEEVAAMVVYVCSPRASATNGSALRVDGFQGVGGVHPGFHRNHAKGLGVSGFFESNGEGIRLSKARVFQQGRVPVIGRFSLGGPQPYVADKPDTVRGLGLQFSLADGEVWRTAMINLPVFPVRTPAGFREQLF